LIIYINKDNKCHYTDLLDQLFKKRYEVFKLGYNWDIPTYGHYELDEYDNHYASYLIYLDDDGDIIGSCRFNPIVHSSMVQDHFRDYCFPHLPSEQRLLHLPRSNDMLEVTRFFCRPKQQNRIGYFNKETLELLAACIELGLSLKMTSLLGIVEQPFKKLFDRLNWQLQEIGWVPAPKDQSYYVVIYPLGQDIYERIMRLLGRTTPLIHTPDAIPKGNHQRLYELMKMKCLSSRQHLQ